MEPLLLSSPCASGAARARAPIRAPWDGAELAEVEQASAADVREVLEVQRRLVREPRARLPVHERAAILRRAAAAVRARREELARGIALEGGKPLVDSRVETDRCAAGLEWLAGEAERLAGDEVPLGATRATDGRLAFTTPEPIGIVAAVSAFNHPLNLIAHQAGPAVAAGCPVIVKPAPETPLSCLRLVGLLHEAGLPPEQCVALPCPNEVAEALVTSDRLAYVSFIGSARVGWWLRSRLAPGVRSGHEHGGAAPVIVDESADLERAVPLLVKGGYYHAGQVCVSVQRVYVHRRRARELEERLEGAVRALRVDDPTLETTDVGPLIREADVLRVGEWVAEAVGAGGRLVTGGARVARQAFAPTLLADPPESTRVMREEVFGPVVCVSPFDTLEEAVSRANSTRWAFQAAVFTADLGHALATARGLDASAVLVNDHTAFRADWMPFGGRRESGLGVGGMPASVRELTAFKLIVLRG
ncbi:MAG: aldehyde dehydrogenase family protein [Polyangiaceae bacterium]|nr:aldehyde dehydrogenase family protein [Polyangiaceae bacterium]